MTNTHTCLTAPFPGITGWAGTRKVKPIWILLKQETVSGSGISWDVCKSATRSRQITMPAPHHSVFYRPDALPVTQPTASKHWRIISGQNRSQSQIHINGRPNNTNWPTKMPFGADLRGPKKPCIRREWAPAGKYAGMICVVAPTRAVVTITTASCM